MIQIPYDLTTNRLAALGEVLSCVTAIVDPSSEVENWKPADSPNRDAAVALQARLLHEISGHLSAVEPKPSAAGRK